MASIEEVWGSPFPKRQHTMASKYNKEEPRDGEKEGRIYPTPMQRTQASIMKNKKTIDDLSGSLPIAESDEQMQSNYSPAKVERIEKMTNFSSYKTPMIPSNGGTSFPYAPPSFQEAANDIKLNQILHMIQQNKTGYEQPSSQDMMLYIFTGVVFLFTLDTFVSLGKRLR